MPLVAGAVLTAVETVKTGFAEVAICWDGGRYVDMCCMLLAGTNSMQASCTKIKSDGLLLCGGLHIGNFIPEAANTNASKASRDVPRP